MRQLSFASLQVSDLEKSKTFYTDKLGFEITDANPQACVFRYAEGQASFAIRTPLEPIGGRELGIGTALWFTVDENVEELKQSFISRGITTTTPVMETPFGRAFHAKDPDGYKLTFLETKK